MSPTTVVLGTTLTRTIKPHKRLEKSLMNLGVDASGTLNFYFLRMDVYCLMYFLIPIYGLRFFCSYERYYNVSGDPVAFYQNVFSKQDVVSTEMVTVDLASQ